MVFWIHPVNASLTPYPCVARTQYILFHDSKLFTEHLWYVRHCSRCQIQLELKGHKRCPHEAEIFRGEWVSYPGGTGREQTLVPLLDGDGFPCLLSLAALKWPCARKSALFFLLSRIKVTKPAFPWNLESHPPCTCTRSCITLVIGDSASVFQHFLPQCSPCFWAKQLIISIIFYLAHVRVSMNSGNVGHDFHVEDVLDDAFYINL